MEPPPIALGDGQAASGALLGTLRRAASGAKTGRAYRVPPGQAGEQAERDWPCRRRHAARGAAPITRRGRGLKQGWRA